MKTIYFLLLLLLSTAESHGTELEVGCRIVETVRGDFKHQTIWNQTFEFKSKELVSTRLRRIKDVSLSVMGAGGMIGKTKKLQITVDFVDHRKGGTHTTTVVLLNPLKSEDSGAVTVFFSRPDKDAVAVSCEPVDSIR